MYFCICTNCWCSAVQLENDPSPEIESSTTITTTATSSTTSATAGVTTMTTRMPTLEESPMSRSIFMLIIIVLMTTSCSIGTVH